MGARLPRSWMRHERRRGSGRAVSRSASAGIRRVAERHDPGRDAASPDRRSARCRARPTGSSSTITRSSGSVQPSRCSAMTGIRLPRARRGARDVAEAGQPGYERPDEHERAGGPKHVIEREREDEHGRRQPRERIALDPRRRGRAEHVEHDRADDRRREPEQSASRRSRDPNARTPRRASASSRTRISAACTTIVSFMPPQTP